MTTALDIQELAKRVRALKPADRLRLAAGLIEEGGPSRYRMAAAIAHEVADAIAHEVADAIARRGSVCSHGWMWPDCEHCHEGEEG